MSPRSLRRWILAAVVLASTMAVAARPGSAQAIRGFLLEGGTAAPIADGLVGLYTVDGVLVDQAESDSTGAFSVDAPSPGFYFLTAEKIGYLDLTHGDFELAADDSVSFDVYLRPWPVELDGVEANVEGSDRVERRAVQRLEIQGFFERMDQGFGDFFTPDMIEERNPTYFSDIIVRLPGVVVDGGILKLREGVRGYCEPNVWIDGILVFGGGGPQPSNDEMRMIDDKIQAQQVSAVEVYRRLASTPVQYSIPNATCGTVLIWTK